MEPAIGVTPGRQQISFPFPTAGSMDDEAFQTPPSRISTISPTSMASIGLDTLSFPSLEDHAEDASPEVSTCVPSEKVLTISSLPEAQVIRVYDEEADEWYDAVQYPPMPNVSPLRTCCEEIVPSSYASSMVDLPSSACIRINLADVFEQIASAAERYYIKRSRKAAQM